ncbi:hypothetical protein D9M71_685660 [compost metagenome]
MQIRTYLGRCLLWHGLMLDPDAGCFLMECRSDLVGQWGYHVDPFGVVCRRASTRFADHRAFVTGLDDAFCDWGRAGRPRCWFE